MTAAPDSITAAEIARRVAELAQLRRNAESLSTLMREYRDIFERQYESTIRESKEAQAAVDAAETALRAVVAARYAATQDKKPAPGVEVKLRSTLQYDRQIAFEWAKSTKMALVPESLDVKAFEKIAKATALPFVTTGEEPMVTIATDLDKALSVAALTSTDAETAAGGR